MAELTIIPLQEPEELRVFSEYEEDKKKFLERNAERFYKAYQVTKSEKLHKIYFRLLEERQKC